MSDITDHPNLTIERGDVSALRDGLTEALRAAPHLSTPHGHAGRQIEDALARAKRANTTQLEIRWTESTKWILAAALVRSGLAEKYAADDRAPEGAIWTVLVDSVEVEGGEYKHGGAALARAKKEKENDPDMIVSVLVNLPVGDPTLEPFAQATPS